MTITIKENNEKYTQKWDFHLLDNGCASCHKGHSKEGLNVSVYYEDTCWGDDEEVCKFFFDNFVLPHGIEVGYLYLDDYELPRLK
jgi:hypothetical protein